MIERLEVSGKGIPTAFAGDRALHSRYDPAGEAEKYIKKLDLGRERRYFVLIEPGLGYSIPPLCRDFPQAAVLVLHVSDFFAAQGLPRGADPERVKVWSPGTGLSLGQFLERELPDIEARRVKVIEWRPALAAYGKDYALVLTGVLEFVKRIDANAKTIRGFGRRWFRNFFKNLGIITRVLQCAPQTPRNIPWIITGAGPGLEASIPWIRRFGRRGLVLAAASSVPALYAGGIVPDLAITTDGGAWALRHLYENIRGLPPERRPGTAASLTSALPSQYAGIPVIPLADGLWQRLILKTLGIPCIALPQRGTVTASALDLALGFTGGPIILAGMDLAHRDIQTHARPYAFDWLQEERAGRLNPRYSQAFNRSSLIRDAGTYRIYAEWFKGQVETYPGRIYSLGANNPVFQNLEDAGLHGNAVHFEAAPSAVRPFGAPLDLGKPIDGKDRVSRAVRALAGYLEEPEIGPQVIAELSPLLLPEDSPGGKEALAAAIKALAAPYE
jgi:hypothetical protein